MEQNYPSLNHSHDVLEWGISQRDAIKKDMDILDARLRNVNAAILSTMTECNIKTFKHELGTLSWKDASVSHGIDKDKLVVTLLASGLSAEKVAEIMAAAGKESKRPASVAFTPDRREKDGDA